MTNSILCLVPDVGRAESIVRDLQRIGFSNNDISVLLPDRSGSRDFAHKHSTKAPEGALTGAGAGGVAGGAFGWLVGIGALAIPGLGPFIAAGPILAALSGAAVGAAVGGVAGALIGLGVPEFEAKQYEGKLKDGNVLISVHCVDSDAVKRAEEIYKRHNAESISTTSEAAVPAKAKRAGEG